MKGRTPIKIALLIIFTFVLTLVMVAFPVGIASAAQNQIITPRTHNSLENECSTETINALEQFVEDMGPSADAYDTLASIYLNCGNYTLAEKRAKQAIKLAEPDSMEELVARYDLVEIAYHFGKINEKQRDNYTEEISKKISSTQSFYTYQCINLCSNGFLGQFQLGHCISCPLTRRR